MELQNLEKALGLQFKKIDILAKALTHRSYLNEHPGDTIGNNERLEFLGDAVLQLTVSEDLFKNHPEMAEGQMTSLRSSLVRTEALGSIALKLNLGSYLRMSKGEEESGGRGNLSLLANTLEALIGAIFIDQGILKVQEFIRANILAKRKDIVREIGTDDKSILQEKVQERYHKAPKYKILAATGPDHYKRFRIGVFVQNELIASAVDLSKQKASKKAAALAIKKLFG